MEFHNRKVNDRIQKNLQTTLGHMEEDDLGVLNCVTQCFQINLSGKQTAIHTAFPLKLL